MVTLIPSFCKQQVFEIPTYEGFIVNTTIAFCPREKKPVFWSNWIFLVVVDDVVSSEIQQMPPNRKCHKCRGKDLTEVGRGRGLRRTKEVTPILMILLKRARNIDASASDCGTFGGAAASTITGPRFCYKKSFPP